MCESQNFSGRLLASPEKESPEILRIRTLLVTLSPREDITDVTVERFVKYIKKKSDYAYVVTELGDNGKRHLHAAVCMSYPVEKRNIQDYWAKELVKTYPGSIGRYACKVTCMYNHKWYDEYLRKGGNVIYDKYDRDKVGECFPTAEQQEYFIEHKGVREVSVHLADRLCDEWQDKDPTDVSYEAAIRFLNYRQHVLKLQPYWIDERKMQRMAMFMFRHRNQLLDPTCDDLNFASKLTGNGAKFF